MALDDQRSRRSHVVTSDGRDGFALFGGFRARHGLAAIYLPGAEAPRTSLAFHRPATVELCRDLAARWGLVVFCGASAPTALDAELLKIPVDVAMEMATPRVFDGPGALWNRSARANIARVKRGRFSFDVVSGEPWVSAYYRQMHRPSMCRRHGARASVVSRRTMTRQARAHGSELLRVFQEGRWIAGSLNRSTAEGYRLLSAGWLQGDAALLKRGAMSAVYWFNFHRAAALGQHRILLGSVAPFLDDGILMHKADWGATLSADSRWFAEFHLLLDPMHPACRRFLQSHSILTRGADGHYVVFSGRPANAVNVSPGVLSAVKRWYVWRDQPLQVPEVTSEEVPAPLRRWLFAPNP